jgi:hypothetical protein
MLWGRVVSVRRWKQHMFSLWAPAINGGAGDNMTAMMIVVIAITWQ